MCRETKSREHLLKLLFPPVYTKVLSILFICKFILVHKTSVLEPISTVSFFDTSIAFTLFARLNISKDFSPLLSDSFHNLYLGMFKFHIIILIQLNEMSQTVSYYQNYNCRKLLAL